MIRRIKSDRIVGQNEIFEGYLYLDGDKILAVDKEERPFDVEYDFTGRYVSAGLIDLHTHGGAGHDFTDGMKAVVAACNFHLQHGTTTVYPTVSAGKFERIRKATQEISLAKKEKDLLANLPGAHLEGPYFSLQQAGAQAADFITAPIEEDYRALVAELGGDIARWSYAPERDEGEKFCRFLIEHGILPAAGHTNAIYDDMLRAKAAGCNLVTHLYSCTSTVTREKGFRRLGVIESAYLFDDMDVEIIADGKHLPPELIRLILKIKGREHVALVTDSLNLAGVDATSGVSNGITDYIIEDGVCKLPDRSAFAGSIATADRLIRVMTQEVGVTLVDAIYMMSAVPARIMGLNKGILAKGYDADVIVFDDGINVSDVFVMGNKVI
ncbi:MAG: amidohydrolase family protein [Clostridia bacterium]|nr:amidohydrolase family protein [Clostridia bacterium]